MIRHRLTTSRLRLEPVREAHAERVFLEMNDERLWTYFPHLRPRTVEELRALYRRWECGHPSPERAETWENWLCFLRNGDAVIGSMQATILADQGALIAYATYVPFQRQGYAREAASGVLAHLHGEHNVKRALVEMDPRNEASIALAESLGFTCARKGVPGMDARYELALR